MLTEVKCSYKPCVSLCEILWGITAFVWNKYSCCVFRHPCVLFGLQTSYHFKHRTRNNAKPQKKRRHSPHDLSSTDSDSEDNGHEALSKRRREEDELSISPSDEDITAFLEESNSKEVDDS